MKIKNFYKNLLVRNAIWVLGGSGTRIFLQAVYFLLIARALGVEQYGAFVGAVSLVAIVVPFSSWGTGFLLIRDVARNHETFARWWGTALAITLVSGSCLLFCALLASRAIWGNSIPWFVLLMVGMSDLIFVRLVDISGQVFVALEVLRKNSEVNVVLGATRTVASVYLYCFVHAPSAQIWSLLYFVGGVTAAVYAIYIVSKSHGLPSLRFYLSRSEFKQGFYFAVGLASQTVYNDLDKTLLVRWGGLAATGIYGAAYRIVDVSFAPVGALVYAAFARFFRYGEGGIEGSTMFVKKILPYTAAYGLIAALGLFFLAPYLQYFCS